MRKGCICLLFYMAIFGFSTQSWGDGSCGLLGEYYQAASGSYPVFENFQFSRVDPVINFSYDDDFGLSSDDHFSIRWTGFIYAAMPGSYWFGTLSDDSSMVYINGNLVVNNGGSHAGRYAYGSIDLTKNWHPIEVTFHEWEGGACMILYWMPPTATYFSIIECVNLSPTSTAPLLQACWLLGSGLLGLMGLNRFRRG